MFSLVHLFHLPCGSCGSTSPGIKPDQKQNIFVTLMAGITMSIYVGFMNYFLLLCILSYWIPFARYIVVGLLTTLALPCQPVLWPAFNRLWIFKTWRHYFHYRWER